MATPIIRPVFLWMLASSTLVVCWGNSSLVRKDGIGVLILIAAPFVGWGAYLAWSRITARHPPRFSLRTLFVVLTVFALWLGWELSVVRERYQLWGDWADSSKERLGGARGGVINLYGYYAYLRPEAAEPTSWRKFLGDRRFDGGTVRRPLTKAEIQILKRAFPTMEIEVHDDFRGWRALPLEDVPAAQVDRP